MNFYFFGFRLGSKFDWADAYHRKVGAVVRNGMLVLSHYIKQSQVHIVLGFLILDVLLLFLRQYYRLRGRLQFLLLMRDSGGLNTIINDCGNIRSFWNKNWVGLLDRDTRRYLADHLTGRLFEQKAHPFARLHLSAVHWLYALGSELCRLSFLPGNLFPEAIAYGKYIAKGKTALVHHLLPQVLGVAIGRQKVLKVP